MILKGSQRAGGQDLAAHLLRLDENDHVTIHELRGFAADDLKGAFKEAEATARGTKCRQYIFSLSFNPPEDQRVSEETFEKAVEQAEDRLGLNGQPRAIVFHEKNGRRHAHCVWSRIDAERMTAKQMSFYKTKLRDLSRELYLEHGWKMPAGLARASERDPANMSLAEWQQAKRVGVDARSVKAAFQDSWAISDSGKGFEKALAERGYFLARGDRRGCVAIDWRGEVYAAARWAGVKTKEMNARMGDLEKLPSVEDVKTRIKGRMDHKVRAWIDQVGASSAGGRQRLREQRAALVMNQRQERNDLTTHHAKRWQAETRQRAERLPRGMKGLWSRLTGKYRELRKINESEALQSLRRDRDERERLVARHLEDRRRLLEQERQLRTKETRELRDLNRAISTRLTSHDQSTEHEADRQAERPARSGGRERAFTP